MKIVVVLKRQQFKDSGSDITESRDSKRQWLDARDDEEGEGLDEFEGEGEREDIGYVPLPFIAPLQKESNRPTNMGEGIKSLNHLVCIPKIG